MFQITLWPNWTKHQISHWDTRVLQNTESEIVSEPGGAIRAISGAYMGEDSGSYIGALVGASTGLMARTSRTAWARKSITTQAAAPTDMVLGRAETAIWIYTTSTQNEAKQQTTSQYPPTLSYAMPGLTKLGRKRELNQKWSVVEGENVNAAAHVHCPMSGNRCIQTLRVHTLSSKLA
jgi:hypothetical protein